MILMHLFTWFFGHHRGTDAFGNRYFSSRGKGFRKERRWVLYAGLPEPSKIPPLWFGWLHYTLDSVPKQPDEKVYTWEKPHQPNLTGTIHAFKPVVQNSQAVKSWNPEGIALRKPLYVNTQG